jgi:hypothetical protein
MRQCNNIPYIDRMEIIQDTWVKIIQKMNEGVLEDDYEKIKGYTFLIVKNFCAGYHVSKKKMRFIDEPYESFVEQPTLDTMDREKLHQMLLKAVENKKFSDKEKEIVRLMLEDYDEYGIKEKLQLRVNEYGRLRQKIYPKLKSAVFKKVKYLLKSRSDEDISIPFHNISEIQKHLNHKYSKNYISQSITKNKDIGAWYVEKIEKPTE